MRCLIERLRILPPESGNPPLSQIPIAGSGRNPVSLSHNYAFRAELPEHEAAKRWIDEQIDTGEIFVMHPLAFGAFLRLTTRRLGPLPPAPADLAIRFLVDLDAARMPEAPNHERVLARLCAAHGIQGDGIVDAWLAAFAITHGMRLASHDAGFGRFAPELEWLDPLR